MRKSIFVAFAMCGALVVADDVDASTLITFDNGSFSEGENLQGALKTVDGISFSISATSIDGNGFPTVFNTDCNGLRIESARPECSGNDDDLSSPFPNSDGGADLDAGLALIFNETDNLGASGPNDDPSGAKITFSFTRAVKLLGLDLLDLGDGNENQGLTIKADGIVILSGAIVGANGEYRSFVPTLTGIFAKEYEFDYTGSGAIDNLKVSAVPLPAALPLMLVGLGGLTLMSRRRRQAI